MSHPALEERFSQRRKMIDGTLRPIGVRCVALLDAFYHVKRGRYVPASLRHLAYSDRGFPLKGGRQLADPGTVALLLEAAQVQKDERVLLPLAAPGYTLALLLHMGADVIAVEPEPTLFKEMQSLIEDPLSEIHGSTLLGQEELCNVFHKPYDIVILDVAEPHVPSIFQKYLTPKGRVVCLTARSKAMEHARMNLAEGHFATVTTLVHKQKEPKLLEDVPLITAPPDAWWWHEKNEYNS